VADRIRSRTQELQDIWSTRYDDESVIMAQNIAEMLTDDIAILESMTSVIVTPIDYAQRMLGIHTAANMVHRALTDTTLLESSYNSLTQNIHNSRVSGLDTAPIIIASQTRLADSPLRVVP
jgi:hypothetical protein